MADAEKEIQIGKATLELRELNTKVGRLKFNLENYAADLKHAGAFLDGVRNEPHNNIPHITGQVKSALDKLVSAELMNEQVNELIEATKRQQRLKELTRVD
jgi:hypothetical protein